MEGPRQGQGQGQEEEGQTGLVPPRGPLYDGQLRRAEGELDESSSEVCSKHPASIGLGGAARTVTDRALGVAEHGIGYTFDALYLLTLSPLYWMSKTFFPVTGLPVSADGAPTRVAIIGGGCAGLSAAWAFSQTQGFDFTVFEKDDRLGGHAHTYYYRGDSKVTPVDLGFIFGAECSYGNMLELMQKTGSQRVQSELSLSVDVDGSRWATDAKVCDRRGVLMSQEGLAECTRFHDLCEGLYDHCSFNLFPFGWWLSLHGFGQEFRDLYLTPTLLTLFISPDSLYGMSARFMFNMFAGPMKFVDLRYAWPCFTVKDGTADWVRRLSASFMDRVRLKADIAAVRRVREGTKSVVLLEMGDGRMELFDHVLFACSSKVAQLLLKGQSVTERFLFSRVRYASEHVVLHTDQSYWPSDQRMRRNFNYRSREGRVELTGDLTRVGQEECDTPLPVVTMNPIKMPAKESIVFQKHCAVHVQDIQHLILTRAVLPMIQGSGGVWYCGSWVNFLGHSGGIDAGTATATRLGARMPLENEQSRTLLFAQAARELFGPRFDWSWSVREGRPMHRAAL